MANFRREYERTQICTPESIEEFVATRARRDHDTDMHNILSVRLNYSPHCEHLRYHPHAYNGACCLEVFTSLLYSRTSADAVHQFLDQIHAEDADYEAHA